MDYKEQLEIQGNKYKDIISKKDSAIQGLTKQLQEMQQRMQQLEITIKIQKQQQNKGNTSFATDSEEEIVNKETAWIVENNRRRNKKRKMKESPESSPQNATSKQNQEQAENQNKNVTQGNVLKREEKQQLPPPIIVTQVKNFEELRRTILQKQLGFRATLLNNEEFKINVNNIAEYKEMTRLLTEIGVRWHTYEIKQDRPIKVMVRNLHPSCKPEEIAEELKYSGFKILNVVNIQRRQTKEEERGNRTVRTAVKKPLALFMLTFNNDEDIKRIYEIKTLQNTVVKIESIRSPKLVPQCKKCQRYGHTQRFCRRDPVCVKCARNHLTSQCDKDSSAPLKCANCSQPHPASYRGCEVAKEMQQRRENANKTKNYNINNASQARRVLINNAQRKPNVSYSRVTSCNSDRTNRIESEPSLN